jgi:hypothetical protein
MLQISIWFDLTRLVRKVAATRSQRQPDGDGPILDSDAVLRALGRPSTGSDNHRFAAVSANSSNKKDQSHLCVSLSRGSEHDWRAEAVANPEVLLLLGAGPTVALYPGRMSAGVNGPLFP